MFHVIEASVHVLISAGAGVFAVASWQYCMTLSTPPNI